MSRVQNLWQKVSSLNGSYSNLCSSFTVIYIQYPLMPDIISLPPCSDCFLFYQRSVGDHWSFQQFCLFHKYAFGQPRRSLGGKGCSDANTTWWLSWKTWKWIVVHRLRKIIIEYTHDLRCTFAWADVLKYRVSPCRKISCFVVFHDE